MRGRLDGSEYGSIIAIVVITVVALVAINFPR